MPDNPVDEEKIDVTSRKHGNGAAARLGCTAEKSGNGYRTRGLNQLLGSFQKESNGFSYVLIINRDDANPTS